MKYSKIRFKLILFLFALFNLLFCENKPIFAQTEKSNKFLTKMPLGTVVPGGNVMGVFHLSGSPYYIDGDILVPNMQTLQIDAGVQVIFNGNYKFTVLGRLIANGSATDSIQFISLNSSIKWKGIRFEDVNIANDTSKLCYCKISGAMASDGLPSISSNDNGGGVYIRNSQKIAISFCKIEANMADNNGGGIYIEQSNVLLKNNSIINNTAINDGGGICAVGNMQTIIQNNKILNNESANAGGIMLNGCNGLIFNNNLIAYNIASAKAGGIYLANGCNGNYANNTISRNKCLGFGDGIYISASNPNIYNTIIWFNEEGSGANIYINSDGAVPNFYYSNIQNGVGGIAGTFNGNYINNVEYTPGFWGWGNDYFDLNFMSPSINIGTPDTINLNLPKVDILGRPRCYNNGFIDIGAYEFQGNQNWNKISGNLSGTLTTLGTPYYVSGDIVVQEGQTLTIEKGIQLYFLGHFSFTVKGTLIANGDESESIIFTSIDTMDFHKSNLNNGAWNRVVIENTSTNTLFKYCDFQFSKAVRINDVYPFKGGAVVVNGSAPKFYNCHFYKSLAQKGGGLAVLNSNKVYVENCKFNDCRSLNAGKGAAVYIENASTTLFGNLFIQNISDNDGGAVYVTNADSKFINNTITENIANKGGAFYINEENSISLKNKLQFFNNILWLNNASLPANGNQLYINSPSDSISINYNDIQGGLSAISIENNAPYNGTYLQNLNENPHFMYSCPTPYALLSSSSCIDMGTVLIPNFVFPLSDIFGNPRLSGLIDIGAYEYLNPNAINNSNNLIEQTIVFPIPSSDMITFLFSLKKAGNVLLNIYNTDGNLIKTLSQQYVSIGKSQLKVNTIDFQSGIYYYQLVTPSFSKNGKIIISK